MSSSPSLPYVGPFLAFLGMLALSRWLSWPDLAIQIGFVAVMLAVLATMARPALVLPGSHGLGALRIRHWPGTVLLGIAVFALWIGPDLLFPAYRHHWLFENSLLGHPAASLDNGSHSKAPVLWLRALRAVVIVPLVEELFWRAWLMRWLIAVDFRTVPLGTWSARAFWIVAILFASEHGSYWDVGLATGVIYNWWMVRTKSLGDLVLAHAVTNACLSLYVVMAGKWEYWG